jgi:hypothetical protein
MEKIRVLQKLEAAKLCFLRPVAGRGIFRNLKSNNGYKQELWINNINGVIFQLREYILYLN